MSRDIYKPDTQLTVRMFIVMFLLAALYLAFIGVMFTAGLDSFTIGLIAIVLIGGQYFFSDRLVLASVGAKPVTPEEAPELHDMVDRLVAMGNMPKPKVAIVRSKVPNAFATGRNPKNSVVAVTTGLLEQLDQPEVEAVLAHELCHVRHRDATVMTLASFFSTVAYFIMRSGFWFGNDRRSRGGAAVIYAASLVVWVISYFLIRALSRYREYAADRGAAMLTGAPMHLAVALQKISGQMTRIPDRDLRELRGMNAFFILPAFKGRAVSELFSTHPNTENRIKRLYRLQEQMEGMARR